MRILRLSGLVLCAFLCLLAARNLIRGPKMPPDEPEPVRSRAEVRWVIAPLARESGADEGNLRTETFRMRSVLPLPRAYTVCVLKGDRNGYPVLGKTWHDSVYLMCPPEGMPG